MRQHPIDLLPEALRARAEARTVASRNITLGVIALVALVIVSTHARVQRLDAEDQFRDAEAHAQKVEAHELRVNELLGQLEEVNDYIILYRNTETPISVAGLIASVVDRLPETVTLDRIDLQMGTKRQVRSTKRVAGARSTDTEPVERVMLAELAGFAVSDNDIAEFVAKLQRSAPFDQVSLDFSRQRLVNEQSAREFRLSFTVDLSRRYIDQRLVNAASGEELSHDE